MDIESNLDDERISLLSDSPARKQRLSKMQLFEIGEDVSFDNPPPIQSSSSYCKTCCIMIGAFFASVSIFLLIRTAWGTSSALAATGAARLIMITASNNMRYNRLPFAIKVALYKEYLIKFNKMSPDQVGSYMLSCKY